jgi:Flp pilus assembly protein TadD
MEVSRTPAAVRRLLRPLLPTRELPARWRAAVLAACCGASLGLTGCQSTGWFSKADATKAAERDDIEKLLAEAKASQSKSKTPEAPATAGATTIEQHLQLGDQALAEHTKNPTRLSDARNHFEEVLRANPNHPVAHHRLGAIADLNRDFASAERHYALALQQNPRDPQLLHDIGYSYLLQEQPEKAIPYLQQSVAIAPTFEMAVRKLADAQVRTRQYDLAAQTLRQVVPEGQVQDELSRLQAAHDPALRPSLLTRVRDNMRDLRPEQQPAMSPQQELLASVEQARRDEQVRLQQQRMTPPGAVPNGYPAANPWSATPKQQELLYNSQLSNAMAEVDRNYASQPGQSLYIDAANGGAPQYAGQQLQANAWGGGAMAQAAQGQQYPGPAMVGGQVPAGYGLPAIAPNSPPGTAVPVGYTTETQTGGAVTNAAGGQGVHGSFQYAEVIRGVQRGTAAPGQGQSFAQRQAVAASPIHPAGGTVPGSLSGGIDAAHYTSNTPTWAAPSLGAGPAPRQPTGNGAAVQSYEMVGNGAQNVSTAWGAADSDELRAAAALGMGAGPGQMFPVIRQTEVASPGTNSLWNGAQFPQPARHLPSERPLADLSRAHEIPSQALAGGMPLTAPPSSLGQQMPSTGQYWTQADQFSSGQSFTQPNGTPPTTGWEATSNFQSQYAQPGEANPLQTYDQLRAQHDAQLNASIQHVQGQYPAAAIATPSYGLPVDRPAAPSALMNSWYQNGQPPAQNGDGRGVVTPEQYPSSQSFVQPAAAMQVAPQVAPATTINSTLPPAQYAPNVVVPRSYQSARGQWPQPNGNGSAATNYQGPMIVPGQ